MRLLVTRPEPDAERTAAALRAAGHTVLVQPLLRIAFNPPPEGLPRPGAILVTSQNGVRALAAWPDAAGWRDVPVYGAGPATGRALAALGFTDVRNRAQDADSLATAVIADLPPGVGPVIYAAARDRAGGLAGGLLARGYDIRTVEAYRADIVSGFDAAVASALSARAIDGVLLFSRRTASALLALAAAGNLTAFLAAPRYFVISAPVADILAPLAARVSVAENPDEDSLLALIPAPV